MATGKYKRSYKLTYSLLSDTNHAGSYPPGPVKICKPALVSFMRMDPQQPLRS